MQHCAGAAILAAPCACIWASGGASGSGSITGGGGGSSVGSWNLSLECLQGRNLAECSFGIEIRTPRSASLSRRRGSQRDVSSPSLTINGTGRIFKNGNHGQSFKDGQLQILRKIREFQSLALQGVAQWRIFPGSGTTIPGEIGLFLGVLALVFLIGVFKLIELVRSRARRGVKSRIMRSDWYRDGRSQSGKRKLDSAADQPSKSFKSDDIDFPVFDRLVIHDGEVITGGSSRKLGQKNRRTIAPSATDPVKRSTLAESNRLSRIRNFLSRSNDQAAKPLFRNSTTTQGSNKEQVGEIRQQRNWNDKDETVQAAESNRKAAIQALAEERKRSLELEIKIRRQKEAAIALEEEVRVLKESHEALLTSLRKKYSSSAAARAAAALLYQNWESGEPSNV